MTAVVLVSVVLSFGVITLALGLTIGYGWGTEDSKELHGCIRGLATELGTTQRELAETKQKLARATSTTGALLEACGHLRDKAKAENRITWDGIQDRRIAKEAEINQKFDAIIRADLEDLRDL